MTRPPLALPHIDDLRFLPSEAKQDRILLDIKDWQVRGTLEQFHEFARALSTPIPTAHGEYRLFTATSGYAPTLPRWKIAGGRSDDRSRVPTGMPLIKGEVRGYLANGVQHVARQMIWRLEARLALNPTRWVRSQLGSLRRSVDFEDWKDIAPVMFADEHPFDLSDDMPLVRGTNVLIGRRLMSLGRPEVWQTQLDRYHRGTLDLIRNALTRAAQQSGSTVELSKGRYLLREVETYWEIQTQHPIEAVREMEYPLRALAARSLVRWRDVSKEARPKVQIGGVDNSPVLRLKLAAGAEARIYAKTTRRVRFEILRRTKEVRDRFTSDDPSSFLGWLELAADHASERLINLVEALQGLESRLPAQPMPRFRLVVDLLATVADHSVSHQLIVQLATNGFLVRTEANGSVIDRLKGQGIIERVSQAGRDHIYQVTGKYQAGLKGIQGWA